MLTANLAWLWLCTLTYNVHVALAERLFPGQRMQRQTFRWRVLQMAGWVIRTGRQWLRRLAEWNRRQLQRWRAALAAKQAMQSVTPGRRRWRAAAQGPPAA